MTPSAGASGSAQRTLARLGFFLGAAVLSFLIAFLVLDLRHADWRVPFTYAADAYFYLILFKGMIDNGWYLRNDFLGMPWPMELHDFPLGDNLHFALVKLGTLLVPDPALVLNAYFVLTFPLTTLTALLVFRHFNIAWPPALLGSLLYTFIPYHFQRGVAHLFLAAYYVVPLVVLVIVWVCERPRGGHGTGGLAWWSFGHDRRLAFSLLICVLIGSGGGFYYSLFACYFLVIAGLVLAVREKHIRPALLPTLLAAVIVATLVANVLPSILHRLDHGATDTARRTPAEAEVYGLKIAQLVLPVTGHRVATLRELKDAYNKNPLVNENDSSSLGVVGSLGFLFLLAWAAVRVAPGPRSSFLEAHRVLSHLSVLNLAALILGTLGGVGAIVAVVVSPQIRAYNRISVYIAFFSLFTAALVLDGFVRNPRLSRQGRLALGALIAALTGLGVLDQAAPLFKPHYKWVRAEYRSDADFVSRIEAAVVPGAMIFQLPFRRFPEEAPTARLTDYDLFKGYVHSRQLRWSHGAVRGSASERWQEAVVGRPPAAFLDALAFAGFTGIYIDRFGYADRAATLEADLATLLGETPMVSANGRLAFFDLTTFAARVQAPLTADELAAKRQESLRVPR